MRQALELALRRDGPTYIRLCRNPTPVLFAGAEPLQLGKIRKLREGDDLTIAVCGVPTFMAIEAASRLAARGVSVDLLEVSTIKPIDAEALAASARKTRKVLTVEEHTIFGGLQDTFAESGDWAGLMRKHGISAGHIEAEAMALAAAESA
jgi:transketolase